MAASVRDLQRSIQPGSVEQGKRGELESNISAALGQQEQAQGGPMAPATSGGNLAIPEDPIGALLSGEIQGDPNSPSTAGLSVGAGPGPASTPDPMMGSRAEQVRQLATQATNPAIRLAARNELRRMARMGV